MSDYARDTWQDLREKRLWPVAVVLALAIVAIPLLLTKSAAQPAADQTALPAPAEDTLVAVTRDDGDAASSGTGSALDRFAEGDPFTPPGRIVAKGDAVATSASTAGPSDGGGTADGGGGSESLPPASSPDAPVPPPVTRTETKAFEYVADVTFWNGDRRRQLRGLRKLDMLPNQSAPVLIFMGTSGQGGNAVFLVDSTLKTTGEGRCVPDRANCAYVHIGPGAEQIFTTETGDAYRLRIDEIRRVRAQDAGAAANPRAHRSAGAGPAARRFQLPSLADLVEVDTTTTTVAEPAAGSSKSLGGR
jgi:hypothetical protein